MPWTGTVFKSLIAAAAILPCGSTGMLAGEPSADAGGGRSPFAPSPPASVQQPDEEAPLLDLDVTGREKSAYPRVDGAVSLEFQNDYVTRSDNKDDEINDLTMSNDLFLAVRATPALSLQTSLVAEDVKDPRPGQNRYFEDVGVYVETLGLVYQSGALTLFAGKFNPTFGVAWDLAPGIYGADLADDYELTERIGFGGAATLDAGALGRHTLTGQTFYLDTSVLSQSWGTQRGRTREGDGGVSNTKSLESFSVTLDGEVPRTLDGLRYQLGVERQRQGRTESHDEWGLAAAVYGAFELAEDVDIEPVLEWVWIRNLEGEPNTVTYATAGAALYIGPWNVAVSSTNRATHPKGGGAFSDPLFQISAGYEFDNGFSLNVGFVSFQDEGVGTNAIGLLLAYDFDLKIR